MIRSQDAEVAIRRGAMRAATIAGFVVLALLLLRALPRGPSPQSRFSPAHGELLGVAGHAGLRRLGSLPLQAQAVISPALGRADRAFAATRGAGGWRLRGAGLRASVDGRGIDVHVGRVSVSIALAGVGRGRGSSPLPTAASVSALGNRIVIDGSDLREWYAAGPLGIEQGYVFTHRLGSPGELRLALALGGSVRARGSGASVQLVTHSGRVVLRYGGLVAVDATGRTLAARIEARRGGLALEIDDRGASYPVRVDPLIRPAAASPTVAASSAEAPRWSVALSRNRATALIGDPTRGEDSGAAWVFARSGGMWAQQGPVLTGGAVPGRGFGATVALSGDGATALIGERDRGHAAGAVRAFTRAGGAWKAQSVNSVNSFQSGTGTVTTVPPPPPSCANVSATTAPGGGSVNVPLSCTASSPGAALIYAIVSGPTHGSLGAIDQGGASVTYTSQSGYTGQDTFTYEATGLQGSSSNAGTATITIPPVARPTCLGVAASTPGNGKAVTVPLRCSAPAGSGLGYTIVSGPAHGSLGPVNQATGAVTYTPRAGYTGQDTFVYDATDSGGASVPVIVTISIGRARNSSLAVSCSPNIFTPGVPTTCTATVTDTSGGAPTTPTGSVKFTSTGGSFGRVGHDKSVAQDQETCTLSGTTSRSSCAVSFMPTVIGTDSIQASYDGDPTYNGAGTSTSVASAPVAGTAAAVTVKRGVVLIAGRSRGAHSYRPLKGATVSIPVGSTIDARKGTLTLITAADYQGVRSRHRHTQSAVLAGAIFELKQQQARMSSHHRRPTGIPATTLLLSSPPGASRSAHCTRTGPPTKGVVRTISGVAKGLYQTVGAASTTTVSNASWTVQDRCDGTLTRVIRGTATVTLAHRVHGPRQITLGAGQSYLARARFLQAKQVSMKSVRAALASLASVDYIGLLAAAE